MSIKNMTNHEISLLLYLETRMVDHGGLVDPRHMNEDDFELATKWDKDGYLEFGRIKFDCIVCGCTNWVYLLPQSWKDAHAARKQRAARMYKERTWKKTREA